MIDPKLKLDATMDPIEPPLDWSRLEALEREQYSPLPGLLAIFGTAVGLIGIGLAAGWLLWRA